ncbi:MAG: hypothetical protein A2135_00310 [Actinobacteria bacterium RBG_16_67_15]|nr:MAG: hypothetical protein A2135_00310 [Actinobacteria bacterium RBG_16_67_15]
MTSRTTGWASIVMALSIVSFIPITMVGYSGAGVDSTDFTDGAVFLPFVAAHRALAASPYVVGLVMHLAGVVLVVGLWSRLRDRSPWVSVAAALGLMWMMFDIAYNGVAIHVLPEMATLPGDAGTYAAYGALTRSLSALQLTGHLGGGIWLAITAATAVSTGAMGRALGRWGVVAGVVFAASVFGPRILFPSFILLPVWFAWFGIMSIRTAATVG